MKFNFCAEVEFLQLSAPVCYRGVQRINRDHSRYRQGQPKSAPVTSFLSSIHRRHDINSFVFQLMFISRIESTLMSRKGILTDSIAWFATLVTVWCFDWLRFEYEFCFFDKKGSSVSLLLGANLLTVTQLLECVCYVVQIVWRRCNCAGRRFWRKKIPVQPFLED